MHVDRIVNEHCGYVQSPAKAKMSKNKRRDNNADAADSAAAALNDDNKPTGIEDVVTLVERRCSKWIETGDPTSIEEFMKGSLLELFPNKDDDDDDDDSQTAEFLSRILNETSGTNPPILLHSETVVKERGAQPTSNNEIENGGQTEDDAGNKVLRRIQLQVMLRLHLWGRYGSRFLGLYGKSSLVKRPAARKKKSKQQKLHKKTNPEALVLEDTAKILALAAFQLPPDRPFPDFVHSCLLSTTPPQLIVVPPKALEYIYDRFELQTPEQKANEKSLSPQKQRMIKRKRSSLSSSNKSISTSSTNSSSAIQSQAIIPAVDNLKSTGSSIPGQIVATIHNKENDNETSSLLLLPKRVPLTAPTTKRRNSLLGDSSSGSRFVGSHFNSSLSNMDSLFRQVKTTKRQPNNISNNKNGGRAPSIQRRRQQQQQPPLTRPNSSVVQGTAQTKLERTKPAVANNNIIHKERVVVHETPCKQQRAAVENRHPAQPRRTSLFVVAETPVPPRPPKASSALFVTRPTTTTTTTTTRRRLTVNHQNDIASGGSGANLVDQARRAIQARSGRRR